MPLTYTDGRAWVRSHVSAKPCWKTEGKCPLICRVGISICSSEYRGWKIGVLVHLFSLGANFTLYFTISHDVKSGSSERKRKIFSEMARNYLCLLHPFIMWLGPMCGPSNQRFQSREKPRQREVTLCYILDDFFINCRAPRFQSLMFTGVL